MTENVTTHMSNSDIQTALTQEVDEDIFEGQVPATREQALALALHATLHVFKDIEPEFGAVLDLINNMIAKQPADKVFTKNEVQQMISTVIASYVNMVNLQASLLKKITTAIPPEQTTPSRTPSYIS